MLLQVHDKGSLFLFTAANLFYRLSQKGLSMWGIFTLPFKLLFRSFTNWLKMDHKSLLSSPAAIQALLNTVRPSDTWTQGRLLSGQDLFDLELSLTYV